MILDADQIRELCRVRDAGTIADAALRGSDHARAVTADANPRELGQLAEAGAQARHQLVDNGVGLVRFIIAQTHYHADWADVFQEGMLAVVKAVDSYDPDRGSFSTFMWAHIRGAVLTAMATDSMRLHLSPGQARDRARVLTELSHRQAFGLPATSTDLAAALNISEVRVTNAMAYRPHAPLADPLQGGRDVADRGPGMSGDSVPVERFVAMLPPKERNLLNLLYGFNGQAPRTIPQIAASLGCSTSTAHRLRDQSHQHLHELLDHFGEGSGQERPARTSDWSRLPDQGKQAETLRARRSALPGHPHDPGQARTGVGPQIGR